jgi:hypothetical protein
MVDGQGKWKVQSLKWKSRPESGEVMKCALAVLTLPGEDRGHEFHRHAEERRFIFFDHMDGDTRRIEAILERAPYGMCSAWRMWDEVMSLPVTSPV